MIGDLVMPDFKNVFEAVWGQGFDYKHPETGWPGRAINIDAESLEAAESGLIIAGLSFRAVLTGGVIAAYPAGTPAATKKPRLIVTTTFASERSWQPASMTTIVGSRPPAIRWFGRDGEPARNYEAYERALRFANAVLQAGTAGDTG